MMAADVLALNWSHAISNHTVDNTTIQIGYLLNEKAWKYYRKTSSISRTKFQNLNVSCIILQLSSLNPLKPGVKLRMKM